MNVLICATQVPFVRGGAEVLVDGLREALVERGHRVDVVALPFKWYPKTEILKSALAWRLLDLTESNGIPVDLVICTKFPTWAVRHPRKVAWLVHQHRQAYDWFGTPLSDFSQAPDDLEIRRQIKEIDRRGLGECSALYAISANVAARLKHAIGYDAKVLHVPHRLNGLRAEAYDDYVFSISRLDAAKRVDLLIRAVAVAPGAWRAVIAGDGPDAAKLQALARELGVRDRVEFRGQISDADAIDLYNRARAIFYGPVDEDFGLAAEEALSAGKPVVTFGDSGGVLELVEHDVSGLVAGAADPHLLGQALHRVMSDEALARQLGTTGQKRVASITWDGVTRELLQHA